MSIPEDDLAKWCSLSDQFAIAKLAKGYVRLRTALEKIATTQPEVSINGICAYCDSVPVAKEALSK